jgi:hypothetical protein
VCDENHFKKLNVTNPMLFVNFKWNYFHIYVHSHYQKKINNNELHIIPLEEYAECISSLGEYGQPCTPWLSFVDL